MSKEHGEEPQFCFQGITLILYQKTTWSGINCQRVGGGVRWGDRGKNLQTSLYLLISVTDVGLIVIHSSFAVM